MPSRSASGAMFLGARASCPHRAEGPQSADRSDTPEPATSPPEAPNAVEVGLGSDVPGSAGILPASGRRPAKRQQEPHARATHPCARGAQCRRGRPWERCSWERGHLARNGPKARKAATRTTHPSHPPPRPRRPMPSRSALGALPRTGAGAARVRGVARLPMWRACGPLAGGTPALPGGGPGSDVPGSAGLRPAPGRRPAKRRQKRHARAGHPPARGAQCRRGRPWVHCRGLALEKPESVGVARLPMWRACGPLAGGTPALPGGGPGSDVPGSAGILPASGRRPAKRQQEPHARATHPRARGAQCRRGRPWERCSWERGHLARNGPKARKAPTGATPPSRPPLPEAPNAVEAGLGCTAEDWRWRSPRAWASPACPCGGPVARLRAGRPRSQGGPLPALRRDGRTKGRPRSQGGGPVNDVLGARASGPRDLGKSWFQVCAMDRHDRMVRAGARARPSATGAVRGRARVVHGGD